MTVKDLHLDIAITPEDAVPPAGRWPFWGTVGWGILVMILSTLSQGVMLGAFTAVDLYARHWLHDLSPAYLGQDRKSVV